MSMAQPSFVTPPSGGAKPDVTRDDTRRQPCRACRRRKIKCNATVASPSPCSRCVSIGMECVPGPNPRSLTSPIGPPPSARMSSWMDALLDSNAIQPTSPFDDAPLYFGNDSAVQNSEDDGYFGQRANSRASSIASSYGSADSGVSHPPQAHRKRQKKVNMSFESLMSWGGQVESPVREDTSSLFSQSLPKLSTTALFPQSQAQSSTSLYNSPSAPSPSGLFSQFQEPLATSPSFSPPPNLQVGLDEEILEPSPEETDPSSSGLACRRQTPRFEHDLYTPTWVRGSGNQMEGWCGICKPGKWLVMKNSAYWYDKSFHHGISAATGRPFNSPQMLRRMDGNFDVWEGLCGSCNDWIALVSSKKKGTTWFRHAYKCHLHPRVRDPSKKRRMSNDPTP